MIRNYWELHFDEQYNGKKAMDSRSECHGTAATTTRELDYFSAYIRLREPDKSEDKAEDGPTEREERDTDARQRIVGPWAGSVMVPQRQDFRRVIDPLLT
ncbi:hypothetical protein BHE74_00055123 [Ensete ventricosum]|nr:hypothetical protein BHE74_00055123 [Ensete ventricosum]